MPGNENDIPPHSNLVPLDSHPHRLTHPALDPVPVYRFPNPPPNDKTKATLVQVIGQYGHHQQGLGKGTPLTPDALKVSIRSQPVLSAHLLIRCPWTPGPLFLLGTGSAKAATGQRPSPYTDNSWRPLRRLDLRTLRPPLVDIRARNPCFRFRRRTLGCQVRFGISLPLRSNSQKKIIPPFPQPCKLCKADGAADGRMRFLCHCTTLPLCALCQPPIHCSPRTTVRGILQGRCEVWGCFSRERWGVFQPKGRVLPHRQAPLNMR